MCESSSDECQGIISNDIKQNIPLSAEAPEVKQSSNMVRNQNSQPGQSLNGYQEE